MACEIYGSEMNKILHQFGLDNFKKGWYSETGTIAGDIALSIKVKKVLFHEKSEYQDICIFDCDQFGRVLVLDNAIQLAEKDEFSYQEMMSFLPLNCHPNPRKVLVIGGGDGGIVREVTKHPSVESITLCEIDQLVIDACKKFLPTLAKGFDSPKLNVYVGDGAEYMRKHKGEFDVIITDSPDPKGAALCLFQKPYFESLKEALKPGGIVGCQGEGFWLDTSMILEIVEMMKSVFPVVDYALSMVGSYTGGSIGYFLCGTSPSTDFRNPIHKFSLKQMKEMGLKYYTPAVHEGSFALPLFLSKELGLKWD